MVILSKALDVNSTTLTSGNLTRTVVEELTAYQVEGTVHEPYLE
jgi:hypothetical protein